ncbi:MAG TPA: 50S ribosomal protein L19e [Methanomicrobia archaeon]|nr:50S ribosomal protein L19e [Methanomicrobia archaeon]
MDLKVQKRIASDVLGCGLGRIWIDPDKAEEVSMAITRQDIRRLVSNGVIKKKQENGISRHRARKNHLQRKRGRRRGHGTLKGPKFSRYSRKERWMNTIRPLRRELKRMYGDEEITTPSYRKLYRMATGGAFRSIEYMKTYMKDHNLYEGGRNR